MRIAADEIAALVLHQLRGYWTDIDERTVAAAVPAALRAIEANYAGMPNRRFWDEQGLVFSPYMSVQWMNFLYRLSHELYRSGGGESADQVYYLNKILHGNDWFYAVELPTHFHCEHPLGSVLGRARYGDYLFVYQGTTVGGNRSRGELRYPTLGDNVILFASATVLGDTHIGSNVVLSAGTQLINETIPDNCLVFGRSPEITVKPRSEEEIREYTKHIWGW